MSNSSDTRDAARKKAQAQFASSEQRDNAIKQEIEKERAAVATKTAKLRALRLAKEATEKVEADRLAAEKAQNQAAKPAARRRRRLNSIQLRDAAVRFALAALIHHDCGRKRCAILRHDGAILRRARLRKARAERGFLAREIGFAQRHDARGDLLRIRNAIIMDAGFLCEACNRAHGDGLLLKIGREPGRGRSRTGRKQGRCHHQRGRRKHQTSVHVPLSSKDTGTEVVPLRKRANSVFLPMPPKFHIWPRESAGFDREQSPLAVPRIS